MQQNVFEGHKFHMEVEPHEVDKKASQHQP